MARKMLKKQERSSGKEAYHHRYDDDLYKQTLRIIHCRVVLAGRSPCGWWCARRSLQPPVPTATSMRVMWRYRANLNCVGLKDNHLTPRGFSCPVHWPHNAPQPPSDRLLVFSSHSALFCLPSASREIAAGRMKS